LQINNKVRLLILFKKKNELKQLRYCISSDFNTMSERIIDGTQLNSENLYFGAPKATAQGAKSVNILNPATKTGLTLSTPLMLTWGASDYKAEGEEKEEPEPEPEPEPKASPKGAEKRSKPRKVD
jgi:hypothetical protein